jgi:hypothetical protein
VSGLCERKRVGISRSDPRTIYVWGLVGRQKEIGKAMTGIDIIIKTLLDYPEQWARGDQHYIIHTSGFKIWIYSGQSSYRIYCPGRVDLTFFERRQLHKAIKKWWKMKLELVAKELLEKAEKEGDDNSEV